jgi:hypothetical protein
VAEDENKNLSVKQPVESTESVEQTAADKPKAEPKPSSKFTHAKVGLKSKLENYASAYWAKKKLTLPATLLVLILIVLAVPVTRYWSLGFFIKSPVSISVTDSKTNQPVSSAQVSISGKVFKSDANGKVSGKIKLGRDTVSVAKQYYTSSSKSVTVTFSKSHNTFKISLLATGRQVPVVITNKVTGKPLANAVIKVAKTEAKTDKTGKAIIVLPTTLATQKASVSFSGYNDNNVVVQVTDKVVAANSFTLTPAGKLYFLSNQSGKIDVVKTNLDGTDRQTVLAGTGSEEPYSTSLLASRDWKYLALQAKRGGETASVYLIDTSTDKLTTIDEGDANFTLVGWANDTLAYYVNRNGYDAWKPKATAIKTYDAPSAKLTTTYETGATGNAQNYAQESLQWVQQLGTKLVWYATWSGHITNYSDAYSELQGKQANLSEYDTLKDTHKILKSYTIDVPTSQYAYTYFSPFNAYERVVYKPKEIYYVVQLNNGNDNIYSEYEDGSLTENSDESKTYFTGTQAA